MLNLIKVVNRTIDDDDLEFIHELLQIHSQEAYFRGWASLVRPIDGVLGDRILVVTNFRLFTIKVEETSRTISLNVPLLDLVSVEMSEEDPYQLKLVFRANEVVAVSCEALHILQAVLFSLLSVTKGVPETLFPRIDVPSSFLEGFMPPNLNRKNGLIASYFGLCDYLEIEARAPIVDYLIQTMQAEEQEFDLRSCLWHVERPSPLDIDAICTCLRFSSAFSGLSVHGVGLNEDALRMLGKVVANNPSITSFCVSSLRGKVSFSPFIREMLGSKSTLKKLTLGNVHIGDQGVGQLCTALASLAAPLEVLQLIGVGMSAIGIKDLSSLLTNLTWSGSLTRLDLSENRLGKGSGSSLVGKVLGKSASLESVILQNCELDLEAVCSSLARNQVLNRGALRLLDISGNKLGSKGMEQLCCVLKGGSRLDQLVLQRCGLKRSLYEQLLRSVGESRTAILNASSGPLRKSSRNIDTTAGMSMNEECMGIALDVSSNELGAAGAKKLGNVFPKGTNVFSELVLGGNDMGADGVVSLCRSLRGFGGLRRLVVDRNVAAGIFTKVGDVGSSLCALVEGLSGLEELSVAGDSSYFLKGGLLPLMRYLCDNSSLLCLNLSGNKFTEECFVALFELIKRNRKLRVLQVDRNRWSVEGVLKLGEAVAKNLTLADKSLIPLEDIGGLYAQQAAQRAVLRQAVDSLEAHLSTNEQSSVFQNKKSRTSSSAVMGSVDSLGMSMSMSLGRNRKASSALEEMLVGPQNEQEHKVVSVHGTPSMNDVDEETKEDVGVYPYDPSEGRSGIKKRLGMGSGFGMGMGIGTTVEHFTLEEMTTQGFVLPKGSDPARKEMYLEDTEFEAAFHVSKSEFKKWPGWKRNRKKKEVGL